MASILSFDSRSTKYLLREEHSDQFVEDFPVFYKNKFSKLNKSDDNQIKFYRSAIDNAVLLNQNAAVQAIINHIIVRQNSFISSFLFMKNLISLVEKGIMIKGLLESDIFSFKFDFDEWPSMHTNQGDFTRPYNGDIFVVRKAYRDVFPENEFSPIDKQNDDDKLNSSKIYKIKYNINLLTKIGCHFQEIVDPETKQRTSSLCNSQVNLLDTLT